MPDKKKSFLEHSKVGPFISGIVENKILSAFLILVAIILAIIIINISTSGFSYFGMSGIEGLFNFALDYMMRIMGVAGG